VKKYINNQSGRSMIEMLGVLAIVGVLSVVGIAGYMKAMDKYKSDKVSDQISTIQHNLQEFYNKQQNYEGIDTANAVKLGIFPDEMIRNYATTGEVVHAGGGTVTIAVDENDKTKIIVSFTNLTKEMAVGASTSGWDSQTVSIGQEEQQAAAE